MKHDAYDEAEPKSKIIRRAYKVKADLVDENQRKLHIPLTGLPREYPTVSGTHDSLREHQTDMRRQIGNAMVWKQFYRKPPSWKASMAVLRRMTPNESERPEMSAVRVVLPKSWSVEARNMNLEYVDSATGVLRKLRASPDKDPSSIILRGRATILSKAVHDIIGHCAEAQVYELGDVAASDYKTKQLWPTIQTGPEEDAAGPEDAKESIWLHKEPETFDMKVPYEEIPRPEEWTAENLEAYVSTLCCGRMPSHMAIRFYGQRRKNGRYIDTEARRIGLINSALEDSKAQPFITAPLLKMALSLMAFKGGHRAEANKLLRLGERLGVPRDVDTFNIMLEGYVEKRDAPYFHSFLRKMRASCFQPNVTTWLLFLRLVRGESERKQIVVAMYELGMLKHEAARRGIASAMASLDAYAAFKAGRSLDGFLSDQRERYGKDWMSPVAVRSIITELLRFHRTEDPRLDDCKRLVQMQTEAGLPLDLATVNLFLGHAATRIDWKTALWALSLLKRAALEADANSYTFLTKLAIKAQSPHALGVVYFYGVLERKLRKPARDMLFRVLLRVHPDPFWRSRECQPCIAPKDLVAGLERTKISSLKSVMSHLERAILDRWDAYAPVKPLAHSLDLAYRTNDMALHRAQKKKRGVVQETDQTEAKAGEDKEAQPVQTVDLATKLRRLDGQPGTVTVRLKGRFDPKTMVDGWVDMAEPLVEEPSPLVEEEEADEPAPTTPEPKDPAPLLASSAVEDLTPPVLVESSPSMYAKQPDLT